MDCTSKEAHTCETCRRYEAVLDICMAYKSVRDPEIRRDGCKYWENERK